MCERDLEKYSERDRHPLRDLQKDWENHSPVSCLIDGASRDEK
jgi:hypothetical protein